MMIFALLATALVLLLRAAPTFLPGYGGTITKGGTTLYMAAWDMGFEVDLLPFDTFSKTPSLGYYFKFFIAGLASGDVRIRGYWDNTAAQMPSGPTLLIRPGATPTIKLTFDGTVGYSLTGIIPRINPKSQATGTSDYDFDYKMLSVTAFDSQT